VPGLVRAIGISNHTTHQIDALLSSPRVVRVRVTVRVTVTVTVTVTVRVSVSRVRHRPCLISRGEGVARSYPLRVMAHDVRSFHPGQVRHQPAWVQQERHVHNQINPNPNPNPKPKPKPDPKPKPNPNPNAKPKP
jgi:hypothetical protein